MSAPPPLSATWQQADDLRAQGNFVAARDLLEPAVDVASIRLGPDDSAVVETQRRLATVHRELGELPAARRVLEEALEGGLPGLGDADPLILLISAELGAIADELGNKHEARRNLARVARHGPVVLGPDHPYVRTSQRYLGMDVPPPPVPATVQPEPAAAEPVTAQEPEAPAVAPVEPGVYRPIPRDEPAPEHPTVAARPTAGPGVYQPAPAPDAPSPSGARPPGPTRPDPTGPFDGWPPDTGPNPMPPQRSPIDWRAPAPQSPIQQSPAPQTQPRQSPNEPYDWAAPGGSPWSAAPPRRPEDRHRSRGPLIAMAVITLAVVAAGAVIGVAVFDRNPSAPASTPAAASPSASAHLAPAGVRLRDDGVSVTLTWTDPTSGQIPFVVAGGRAGQESRAFQTLPAGSTTYTVNGLNPAVDYCFTVVAVYNENEVATSVLACTQRAAQPSATASR